MDDKTKNKYIEIMNKKAKMGIKPTLEECCNGLQFYIQSLAKKHINEGSVDMIEDFYQQGYLAICQHYDEYDPKLSAPTTFFQNHIKHEIQKSADNTVHKMSSHYSKRNRDINKAIETLQSYGIKNPTDKQIQLELKAKNPRIRVYSIQTARQVINSAKEVSYDDPNFVDDYSDDTSLLLASPENTIIRKSMVSALRNAIKKLPELQQTILQLRFFPSSSEQKTTMRAISLALGETQDRIKKEYNAALKTLSKDDELKVFNKNNSMDEQKKTQHRSADIGIVSPKAAFSLLDTIDSLYENEEDMINITSKETKKKRMKYDDFSD